MGGSHLVFTAGESPRRVRRRGEEGGPAGTPGRWPGGGGTLAGLEGRPRASRGRQLEEIGLQRGAGLPVEGGQDPREGPGPGLRRLPGLEQLGRARARPATPTARHAGPQGPLERLWPRPGSRPRAQGGGQRAGAQARAGEARRGRRRRRQRRGAVGRGAARGLLGVVVLGRAASLTLFGARRARRTLGAGRALLFAELGPAVLEPDLRAQRPVRVSPGPPGAVRPRPAGGARPGLMPLSGLGPRPACLRSLLSGTCPFLRVPRVLPWGSAPPPALPPPPSQGSGSPPRHPTPSPQFPPLRSSGSPLEGPRAVRAPGKPFHQGLQQTRQLNICTRICKIYKKVRPDPAARLPGAPLPGIRGFTAAGL